MLGKIFNVCAAEEAAEVVRDAAALVFRNAAAQAAHKRAAAAVDDDAVDAPIRDVHVLDVRAPNVHVRDVPIFYVRGVLCRIRVPK